MNSMHNDNKTLTSASSSEASVCDNQAVLKYEKPVLVVYGDVRDITLGPTAGLGESGCEFDRRVGSPLECP